MDSSLRKVTGITRFGPFENASHRVSFIIGRGGCNVKEIVRKYGERGDINITIVVEKKYIVATIVAKNETQCRNTAKALRLINEQYKSKSSFERQWTPANLNPGAFIGKGGSIIKKFNRNYQVHVHHDTESGAFVIRGQTKARVDAAIQALIAKDIKPRPIMIDDVDDTPTRRSTNQFDVLGYDEDKDFPVLTTTKCTHRRYKGSWSNSSRYIKQRMIDVADRDTKTISTPAQEREPTKPSAVQIDLDTTPTHWYDEDEDEDVIDGDWSTY